MGQANFENWSDIAKKVQEPIQAIAELNVKTLQSMAYIKPEELTKLKKPEELLEKQVALAIENGHKALAYMEKSFEIFEKTLRSFTQEIKDKTAEVVRKH